MALLVFVVYTCLLSTAFIIFKSLYASRKRSPAGCGSAPVYPLRPFWDIFDIVFLASILHASWTNTLNLLERSIFAQLSARAGCTMRTMTFSRLGSPTLFTMDPVNVNAVLVSQFPEFLVGDRRRLLEPLLGYQILSLDGEAWKHSRARVRPVTARERISDLNAYERHTTGLLIEMGNLGHDGRNVINVQSLFETHTLRISMEFFGLTNASSDIGDEETQVFASAFNHASGVLVQRMLLGKLYWLADSLAFRRACKACHDLVDKKAMPKWIRVQAFKNANPDMQDVMPVYSAFDELVQNASDYTRLRSSILGLIVATRDNSASMLAWLFYYLSRHPDTYALLREAVIKDFGASTDPEKPLSFAALKACTYLQYCSKEVLRLEPPIIRSIKRAGQDTALPRGGGPDGSLPLFVTKGTDIIWSTREMQRDQEYWGEDADEWRPDRWATARPTMAYAPFNAGPRTCPGQQMGLTLVAYTMVRLVQRYERLESCETDEVVKMATGLVAFKQGGVKVRMIPAKF